jgi:hypothetical protein
MFNGSFPCSGSVKEENKEGRYNIEGTNLEFKIKYKVQDLDAELPQSESIFLAPIYQQLLEDCPSGNTESIYIPVYESGTIIGVIHAQSTLVKGKESLNLDMKAKGIRTKIKNTLLANYNKYWFVVGNLLLSGNYGLRLKGKTTRESFVILETITKNAMPLIEKEKGHRFSFLFYKDFSEEEAAQSEALTQRHFHCVKSEPNMVLELPKEWDTFDDYLAAMSSKYRVRAKRAFKKGKDLKRVDMTAEQIEEHKQHIHQLYQKVSHSVDFNLVYLHEDYYPEMKRRMKDDFRLVAYFLEDKMIGYFTTIKDHHETHAHYLGMEYSYNNHYQLYLNMLYDIIRVSIEKNKSAKIDFARTAPEIKSSVGATPEETFFYLRHTNSILNRVVARITSSLQGEEKEIIYRSPFKEKPATKVQNNGKAAASDSHSQRSNR